MDTKDILDECKRVEQMVDERMGDEGEDVDFSWEEAIEERDSRRRMGSLS